MLTSWRAGWERDADPPSQSAAPAHRAVLKPAPTGIAGWSTPQGIRAVTPDSSRSGVATEMAGKAASSMPSTNRAAVVDLLNVGFLPDVFTPPELLANV